MTNGRYLISYCQTLALLASLMATSALDGQWTAEATKLDFGLVTQEDDRIMESYFIRSAEQRGDLLRVEVPRSLMELRYEAKRVNAGDTLFFRVKLFPRRKGEFKDKLTFYFVDETITLEVLGDVRRSDFADTGPCPDFGKDRMAANRSDMVEFRVFDRETNEPVHRAELIVRSMKGQSWTFKTDRNGLVKGDLPMDYYYLDVDEPGFFRFQMETYINRTKRQFDLPLRSGRGYSVSRRASEEEKKPQPEAVDSSIIELEVNQEEPIQDSMVVEPEFRQQEQNLDYSIQQFKPNHLVFLIDVSTSMGQQDRLELVQLALTDLLGMLRPQDRFSVVTYADKAEVLIDGAPVAGTYDVDELLSSLTAEGSTAGRAGVRKAYQLGKTHFIEGGNNHIFLLTDGAFNKDSERIKTMVDSETQHQRRLSVVAVRNSKWATGKMAELAEAGEGELLSLEEESDASLLRELVKRQSIRR